MPAPSAAASAEPAAPDALPDSETDPGVIDVTRQLALARDHADASATVARLAAVEVSRLVAKLAGMREAAALSLMVDDRLRVLEPLVTESLRLAEVCESRLERSSGAIAAWDKSSLPPEGVAHFSNTYSSVVQTLLSRLADLNSSELASNRLTPEQGGRRAVLYNAITAKYTRMKSIENWMRKSRLLVS